MDFTDLFLFQDSILVIASYLVVMSPQSPFACDSVLVVPCFFMTLAVKRSAVGLVSCSMHPSLGLSEVFLMIRLGLRVVERTSQRGRPLSSHHLRGYMTSIDILDHWVKQVFPRLFHYIVPIFPFSILLWKWATKASTP